LELSTSKPIPMSHTTSNWGILRILGMLRR
jgi:hypothetical protein